MIGEILRVDGDRFVPLALLVLLALPARLEAVEQHGLPVDVVIAGLLGLGLGRRLGLGEILRLRAGLFGFRRIVVFVLGLDELEKGVLQQLLLEMLLEVDQRHVEHVHRLIEAWIRSQLLPEPRRLVQPTLHADGSSGGGGVDAAVGAASGCSARNRSRSRVVSVGPK